MPFDTAVSGLNAASQELKVIGNNIANSATVGFKSSRAEFSDVFPTSNLGASSTGIGSGVQVSNVSQQFTQGNVTFTNNNLDMAINGQGFFRVSDNGSIVYSRNGSFSVDDEGYIINSSGQQLTGYVADASGNITGSIGELQVDTNDNPPQATTEVTALFNLDAGQTAKGAGDPALAVGPEIFQDDGSSYVPPRFEAPDPDSYNHATSFTVYDSLGTAHTATAYYRKTGDNQWTMELSIDNQDFVAPAEGTAITFDTTGALITPAGPPAGVLTYTGIAVGTGAANLDFTVDLSDTTQFGSSFSVNALTQNGFTTGRLTGVDIAADGTIFARYTNGESQALGQVVLANFSNPQGLQQVGNQSWVETADSGEPLVGEPGTGSLGLIQSGALEESNVDLTAQLVSLIITQRNFQANAQVISTADQVTQAIINLR